jgi:hypothetical protein
MPCLGVILLGLFSSSAWCADEIPLKPEEVPTAVMAVMVKSANGSPLMEYVQALEDGKTVYSAEFKNEQGKLMEVTVSKEATLIAVELEEEPPQAEPAKTGAPAK